MPARRSRSEAGYGIFKDRQATFKPEEVVLSRQQYVVVEGLDKTLRIIPPERICSERSMVEPLEDT